MHLALSILVFAVALTPLLGSSVVKAATQYDDVVEPVANLVLGCGANSTIDITNIWHEIGGGTYSGGLTIYTGTSVDTDMQQAIRDTNDIVVTKRDSGTDHSSVRIFFTGGNTLTFKSSGEGTGQPVLGTYAKVLDLVCTNDHTVGRYYNTSFGMRDIAFSETIGGTAGSWVFMSTANITYPSGYEGVQLPDVDLDMDGLTTLKEASQDTSDLNKDTDGDGLSDFIESEWNPDLATVFCGVPQCAYPDPIVKDVYVELDWMKDSLDQEYRPSATQLEYVEDMFDAKGVKLHIDTGQFGGGSELSVYTESLRRNVTSGQVDFKDYKNGGDSIAANFSTNRNSIWRYMVTGNSFLESPGSSGWSEVMGDELFISYGVINARPAQEFASKDRAIANTIAHELGHSLCLSDERVFIEQPAGCIYEGIDNNSVLNSFYHMENYESVMNYRYQLTDFDDIGVVNYSDGSHGTGDHDDWSAALAGMGNFSGTHTLYGAKLAANYIQNPDGSVVVEEAPVQEIRDESNKVQNLQAPTRASTIDVQTTQEEQAVRGAQDVSSRVEGDAVEKANISQVQWPPILLGGSVVAVAGGVIWYIRRR